MAKVIRCQCGFLGRGETAHEAATVIETHMREDHPELVGKVTREDLVATTHALDRVLMAGHYMIPFYYLGADNVAYRTQLHHPETIPLTGMVLESWWVE